MYHFGTEDEQKESAKVEMRRDRRLSPGYFGFATFAPWLAGI